MSPFTAAYKNADGRKMDNRRVLVDVERARTVKGWLSRRLGGGLGGTRRGGPDVNIKHSGREDDRKRGVDDTERDTDRVRSRDRSRDRSRKRSRSREKEREREPRRRRSRSRERERKRRRSRDRVPAAEVVLDDEPAGDTARRRHRSRSRDRDRERKHRRSRSRERRHRRERERGERGLKVEGGAAGADGEVPVKIKQEPDDDYPDYSNSGPPVYNNIPLKDEDGRPKNGTKFEEEEEGNNEIDY